jgi:hypothetical protein
VCVHTNAQASSLLMTYIQIVIVIVVLELLSAFIFINYDLQKN